MIKHLHVIHDTWLQVVAAIQNAGASAVLIHGRTQEQRYNKAADWPLISRVATASDIPIIGNGDILTLFEVHGCSVLTESLCNCDQK